MKIKLISSLRKMYFNLKDSGLKIFTTSSTKYGSLSQLISLQEQIFFSIVIHYKLEVNRCKDDLWNIIYHFSC